MTATQITHQRDAATIDAQPALWKPGLGASVVAAVATTAVAVGASAIGVSLEAGGQEFPVLAFTQLTLVFSVVGLVIASVLRRRVARPRARWVQVTLVLTAMSLVPDLLLDTDAATRLTLMLTHVVAAAIVIPVVARRLPAGATR